MPLHTFKSVYGKKDGTVNRSAAAVTYTTTSVTSGATIGVYTATPTQVIASTAHDASMLRITNVAAVSNSNARGDLVADIMIGGAGAEVPIIQGLIFGGRTPYSSYTIPVFIPSGTRISMRTAAGVASRAITFSIDYFRGAEVHGCPARWVAYGLTVSSGVGAYGTIISPGSTNTWSAWTALTTSTTYAHELWLPMYGNATATTITANNYRTQFAIANTTDAATMATNGTGIFEGPWATGSTTEQLGQYPTGSNPIHVGPVDIIYAPRPSGSSVSARAMCSSTPDTNATSCAILAAVK